MIKIVIAIEKHKKSLSADFKKIMFKHALKGQT